MSNDNKIFIKLGPLIERNDDEYLPMELTIRGNSVTWVDTELKKCEDHTFNYEFSSHVGDKGASSSQSISCHASSFAREINERLESLNIMEELAIGGAAAESRENIGEHEACQGEHQEPQIDNSASTEIVENVESSEKYSKPKLQKTLAHTNPVSAVAVYNEWVLTGCYDGTLHIWTLKGKHHFGVHGHAGIVEAVVWLSLKDDTASFVSTAKDETTIIWVCHVIKNAVISRSYCTHERKQSLSWLCVLSVNYNKTIVASGGLDSIVKFWSAPKRNKNKHGKPPTSKALSTIKTLEGHTDIVSGIVWSDKNEIISGSLDETIKVWDFELSKIKREFTDYECFYKLDYSPLCRSVIASTHDRVRLYDPRATGGLHATTVFNHRNDPVRCLKWSTEDQNIFILATNQIELWDIRNTKEPLYYITGHDRDVVCCDWSNPKFVLFGSEDNLVRIYKSTQVLG